MSQKKSHMISSKSDPAIVNEDWINDLLECEITLLARRGESLTLNKSCDDLTGTSDYLESVHSMDQEDIRCLMPKPRDLHDFCSTECVAMEIYPDSHLQGLDQDIIVTISDKIESKMSNLEEEVILLNPSESDESSSETITTRWQQGSRAPL